jgi:uncharacterized protein
MTTMIRIAAINIYPVKACRGIARERALVTATGFEHDREWLIVRPNGRFITQREEPRLASIETALTDEVLRLRVSPGRELTVPLAMQGTEVEVTCWRDQCAAFDAGEDAAAFLTEYLDSPVRLVRFDTRRKRSSNREWTHEVEALYQFADAFAWLAISQESLDDLNARLQQPLPMNRFRPNIVLEGLPPFGEDRVHEFTSDGVRLRAVKACTRCIVTTTDQATGRRDGDEPLRTLRQFRFDRELKGVTFGQNLILIEGAGRELRVGQQLAVVEKAAAR